MKYILTFGILSILAAGGIFIWQRGVLKAAGKSGQPNGQQPNGQQPNGQTGQTGSGSSTPNSFISSSGTCPLGYRTTYNTVECFMAPCPAQTVCTKDALLQSMGLFTGFTGFNHGFHNFPLN